MATRRVTGLAGLATALIFAAGNAVWALDQPKGGASGREVVGFYADASDRIVVGGSLSLIAIALFVLFASGVRAILREHQGDDLLADTAFGGTLLMCAAGLAAESINMAAALRAGDGKLSEELARSLFEISYVSGYNAAGIGIGILLLAAGAAALRREGLMPRWTAWIAIVLGLAFLTPLSLYLLAPAVLLLGVVSALLLRQAAASP
ncbi:MAG TPA: hypothetical protein VF549_00835 [Solirubrobacteraceae bacterium]|jgi:hypothetical protein